MAEEQVREVWVVVLLAALVTLAIVLAALLEPRPEPVYPAHRTSQRSPAAAAAVVPGRAAAAAGRRSIRRGSLWSSQVVVQS